MLFLCELSDLVGRKCYSWMGLQVPSQTNNVIFRGVNVDWEAVLCARKGSGKT